MHFVFDQGYLQLFREAVVNKIAAEWNTTIAQSMATSAEMNRCNASIQDSDRKCQECTKQCQTVPLISDIVMLLDPYTYMSAALNDLTIQIGSLLELVETRSLSFLNYMYELAKTTHVPQNKNFEAALKGIEEGVYAAKHGFSDDGRYVSNTASHTVLPAYKIDNFTKVNLDTNTTALDNVTTACTRKCDECSPLLLPTPKDILMTVCGNATVNMMTTFISQVDKLRTIYDAVVNVTQPILSQIELDLSSMNNSLGYSYTVVYVTMYIRDQYQRYRTHVLFSNMYREQTARNMTLEFWNKVDSI